MCALSSEAILLIQVSDFLCQISDVTTQLVVPETREEETLLEQLTIHLLFYVSIIPSSCDI